MTFTHDGRREFSRNHGSPLVLMVRRPEFDDRLRRAAADAGAEIRERVAVRAVDQDPTGVRIRLADGTQVTAGVVIGADGSSGITGRHVGVRYNQVDLGLEVELPVPAPERERWAGRLLLDWGPHPRLVRLGLPQGRRAHRRRDRGARPG